MSNHRKEFENFSFDEYCNLHGISHQFSAPITPQENRVVKKIIGPYRKWLE